MNTFLLRFAGDDPDDEDRTEEPFAPPWLPQQNELGLCIPLNRILARSDRGVIAVRSAIVQSNGTSFDLVAAVRGLRQHDAARLFHEQHMQDPTEGLPDGFVRVGFELADGSTASNIAHSLRHFAPDNEPDRPILIQHGGGGSQGSRGQVVMQPNYWLWPLPPAGPLKLVVEWPLAEIPLTETVLDGTAIRDASKASSPLWDTDR